MNAERLEIAQQLIKMLDEVTDGRVQITELDEDADVINDIGLSSLDMIDVSWYLQRTWGLTLSQEDLGSCRRAGGMIDLILTRGKPTDGSETPLEQPDSAPTA